MMYENFNLYGGDAAYEKFEKYHESSKPHSRIFKKKDYESALIFWNSMIEFMKKYDYNVAIYPEDEDTFCV